MQMPMITNSLVYIQDQDIEFIRICEIGGAPAKSQTIINYEDFEYSIGIFTFKSIGNSQILSFQDNDCDRFPDEFVSIREALNFTPIPSLSFDHFWDSLEFSSENELPSKLFCYLETTITLTNVYQVDMNQLFASNRLVLLYGPPGTGKTNPEKFLILLIDEVESISNSRKRIADAGEPSDSMRAVNSFLTQLDSIKVLKNIFIFTTSNFIDQIDSAFLDRVDIIEKIELPNEKAIYKILRENTLKLMEKGVIYPKTSLLDVESLCSIIDKAVIYNSDNQLYYSKLLWSIAAIGVNDSDIIYEEDILRNPYSLKAWNRLLQHKRSCESPLHEQHFVVERALLELPGSYKLWKQLLDSMKDVASESSFNAESVSAANGAYERALVTMNKMPRIWIDYCRFLVDQGSVTKARRTFDRALRALPFTQHKKIWKYYLEFASDCSIPQTSQKIFRRYLKFEPADVEDYIEFLIDAGMYDEATLKLCQAIEDPSFVSKFGKTKSELCFDLCKIICANPKAVKSLNVETILRSAMNMFPKELGLLWTSLGNYYIFLGMFEKARSVFEEALSTGISTAKDFSQIFDSYTKFEESVITLQMQYIESGSSEVSTDETFEVDLRLARLEALFKRRPFLLNSVLIRHNPNDVANWVDRVNLFESFQSSNENEVKIPFYTPEDANKSIDEMKLETFTKALQEIQPKKAIGHLPTLWIRFAQYYISCIENEHENNISNSAEEEKCIKINLESDYFNVAIEIYEKATQVDFRNVTDLADIWIAYSIMWNNLGQFDKAIDLMARATVTNRSNYSVDYKNESIPVQMRLIKCLKLWIFYLDLSESLLLKDKSGIEFVRAIYERVLELKIITPQILVNYATLLERFGFHEDSFRVYERGIDLFNYPIAFEFWNIYIPKFIEYYKGKNMERTRDLFEQSLVEVPEKYAVSIYLYYAKFEEDYGLIRNALKIYQRCANAVSDSQRFSIYQFFIAKTANYFGVTATREVFEDAIEALPDPQAKDICLAYASLETKLGEIERARLIYAYGSAFCDPRTVPIYWEAWHSFEVSHGSEATFREMLRIKRSVQEKYADSISFMISSQMNEAKKRGLESDTAVNADSIKKHKQQIDHEILDNSSKGVGLEATE